jgi:hypothetical protein
MRRGRFREIIVVVLLIVTAGCGDSPRAVGGSPTRDAIGVASRTGLYVDTETSSSWNSEVAHGKVTAVVEHIVIGGDLVGERRYEFDSSGALRRFVENVSRPGRQKPDSTQPDTEARISEIELVSGNPVLYSRRFGATQMRYDSKELRRIVARGNALFDSSTIKR